MKTLIIVAHPSPSSFNKSIVETCIQKLEEKNHEIRVRDLYEMSFNPVLKEDSFTVPQQEKAPSTVREEQEHINWAENLIFIFPTWWGGMPAILKGYFDRVFTNGFAFEFQDEGSEGLLTHKKALIFQTTANPKDKLKSLQLITAIETIIDVGILQFCGIETIAHKFFYSVPYIDDQSRKDMLKEVEDIIEML
ncbi:NAD(P)H-dependent oxidoreductase [Bacillus sp. FJAT-47783]|uniref:NAD(P)H-dependent oxidoreductase n=1 Tax=Bacillus sp. FJAT-47783 TaxID=2922712 RepID=UPI001FAB7365|nr:NAD(P)H-dependent oxidoreductase [Bacillus sp. FJAT-47783]